jgi:hypothetical protein
MTNDERDKLITEMHTDIKWIKDWTVEHKMIHFRYVLLAVGTLVGVIVSLLL